MRLRNTVIYLLGIPAVGKYTIGKEIARQTGAKLVDSQVINFPVYSVVGYDGTDAFPFPREAAKHIETIHRTVVSVIRDLCPREASFIFTNVLDANDPGDRIWFDRIAGLASDREATFIPVWLTCDAATIRMRKNASDRRERLKDIDLTNIDRWVNDFEVLRVDHPNALTLKTSVLSPQEAARLILEHAERINTNQRVG